MEDETEEKAKLPDRIQRALDICAKAIIIIPAGAFIISIGCNAAFFAGLGVGLYSIPFSISDFVMAFRMWATIFIFVSIISFLSFMASKLNSYMMLNIFKYMYGKFQCKFIYKIIQISSSKIDKTISRAIDLLISLIVIFVISFMKGAVYPGSYGSVYVKTEGEIPIEMYSGNITSLEKGIILKQGDDQVMFIFNDNIKNIEFKIYKKSISEKLMDLL